MTNRYKAPLTVTMSDAGPGGMLKIPALFKYPLGITAEHSMSIGFGGEDILRQDFHWVIARYRLSIDKLPVVNDKFSITTWRPGEDIYDGHILKEIAINFRLEIRYGESILSQAENINDGTLIHKLISASTGAELTRGITKWDRS